MSRKDFLEMRDDGWRCFVLETRNFWVLWIVVYDQEVVLLFEQEYIYTQLLPWSVWNRMWQQGSGACWLRKLLHPEHLATRFSMLRDVWPVQRQSGQGLVLFHIQIILIVNRGLAVWCTASLTTAQWVCHAQRSGNRQRISCRPSGACYATD